MYSYPLLYIQLIILGTPMLKLFRSAQIPSFRRFLSTTTSEAGNAAAEVEEDFEPVKLAKNPYEKEQHVCVLCKEKVKLDYKNSRLLQVIIIIFCFLFRLPSSCWSILVSAVRLLLFWSCLWTTCDWTLRQAIQDLVIDHRLEQKGRVHAHSHQRPQVFEGPQTLRPYEIRQTSFLCLDISIFYFFLFIGCYVWELNPKMFITASNDGQYTYRS